MTPRERAEARAREIARAIHGARLPGRNTTEMLITEALAESYDRADAAERRADGTMAFAALDVNGKIIPSSIRETMDAVRLAAGECTPVRVAIRRVQAALRQPAQPNMGEDGGPAGIVEVDTGFDESHPDMRAEVTPGIVIGSALDRLRAEVIRCAKEYVRCIHLRETEGMMANDSWFHARQEFLEAVTNLEAEERGP